LSLPSHPIPAPGFKLVSGKGGPRKKDAKYMVQFRNGWIDEGHEYTAAQMVWVHEGRDWDIVAVKEV
jgi:hypothetical protein